LRRVRAGGRNDAHDIRQNSFAARFAPTSPLLAPEEIRSIRARYALSQAELERMLGLAAKTVVRWERGADFTTLTTPGSRAAVSTVSRGPSVQSAWQDGATLS